MISVRRAVLNLAADVLDQDGQSGLATALRSTKVRDYSGGPYFKVAHGKRGAPGEYVLHNTDFQAVSDDLITRIVEPDDERLLVVVEIPVKINMHAKVTVEELPPWRP